MTKFEFWRKMTELSFVTLLLTKLSSVTLMQFVSIAVSVAPCNLLQSACFVASCSLCLFCCIMQSVLVDVYCMPHVAVCMFVTETEFWRKMTELNFVTLSMLQSVAICYSLLQCLLHIVVSVFVLFCIKWCLDFNLIHW